MKHYPVYLSVQGQHIALSGGADAALAKLRLLMKTEAQITVFAPEAAAEIRDWATQGKLTWVPRALEDGDLGKEVLFYAADEDEAEDARTAAIARKAGVLANIVDNLQDSQFITPAIVDRDPVTVAIGTEGAAPVLARAIKAELEERLSPNLGMLARIGKTFRKTVEVLPFGRARRDFWSDYYFNLGPRIETQGESAAQRALNELLVDHVNISDAPGHVSFVGAGPGDPELLTLKARKALDKADVVIYDRLVAPEILELARREAVLIDAGKTPYGQHTPQDHINALMVEHAHDGHQVVRLKSGDPTVFGRLDEEMDALDAAEVTYTIVPGITAASASVAAIGQSLTKRGRNSGVRFLTGHDVEGFADHDWRTLASPGEVAAIYMGKKAAHFIQGRLLMHGADPATPVTVIENASRADQHLITTTLATMAHDLSEADLSGPALPLIGLNPRAEALAHAEGQAKAAH
ncbi:siroheme synthase CysG [Cognatishimia activa]|uniref:siroheme synthase CysG n=1 Tax=Cognatishimia activa TaxID=1715691 RepID=UPI0006EECA4B|nr:siroheme synthase CysG [Cognatishimia activa]CUJ34024.1 Siroheme synthase [Cognatishimia activa]